MVRKATIFQASRCSTSPRVQIGKLRNFRVLLDFFAGEGRTLKCNQCRVASDFEWTCRRLEQREGAVHFVVVNLVSHEMDV